MMLCSVFGKCLNMFGTTWVCELTFSNMFCADDPTKWSRTALNFCRRQSRSRTVCNDFNGDLSLAGDLNFNGVFHYDFLLISCIFWFFYSGGFFPVYGSSPGWTWLSYTFFLPFDYFFMSNGVDVMQNIFLLRAIQQAAVWSSPHIRQELPALRIPDFQMFPPLEQCHCKIQQLPERRKDHFH